MESESARSEPGSRSRRGRGIHNPAINNISGVPVLHHRAGDRSRHSHRSGSSHAKNKKPDMAPFQTTVNLDENGRDGQEIIEVQILPRTCAQHIPISFAFIVSIIDIFFRSIQFRFL